MLPDRLIDVKKLGDGTRAPEWLSSRDEVWLRLFCDELEAFSGRTVAGVERRMKEIAPDLARRHGLSQRRIEAVWTVERRRWRKEIDAPVDPSRIRSVVFDHAARYPQSEALLKSAAVLDVDVAAIRHFLFADRDDERILLPPEEASTPAVLVESHNLALVQSLLARAIRITVLVRSDLRHVLSFAKLLGLMVLTQERTDGGVDVELSGPLALFHDTRKYGYAVARFFPALATTIGWEALAEVQLRGEVFDLSLTARDPLPRVHALPRGFDSKLEKRLAADLRRIGHERGWRLERESAVVSTGVGAQLFYPDFTLVSERGRVLVEVVGFWTPDYLAKKQRALEAVQEPIVVCVQERHAAELGIPRVGHAEIVTYRDRIDAGALLDAADLALRS